MENTASTIPRRVLLAILLAFIFNGFFILTARYRLSYDAFTHMFFADHYARDWFSLWDTRWFGGFEVISYPPLVHQLIALLSRVIGIDAAYAAIQWIVVTTYPLAVYVFSRIFFGRSVSSYAALGTTFLSSLYYAAYAFGQLPTLTATLFALFGLAALADFLRSGNILRCMLAIALMIVTMASHHATLLFLPWPAMAVIIHIFLNQKVNKPAFFRRLCLFLIFSIIGGLIVIWPFWLWGTTQKIQTPIDHLSRHNFFKDPMAFLAFFLPMYGGLTVLFPFVLWKGFNLRYLGLTLAFLILLILGLGGTTPLPYWIFRSGWEWLTYDRFAFWGSLMLIPFLGIPLIHIRRILPRWLAIQTELISSHLSKPLFSIQKKFKLQTAATIMAFFVFAMVAFVVGSIPTLFHTQPNALDMQPIVNFLNTEDHSSWRYLTFGFGDQMAYLSRLTNATTMDGSYFTARTLPELRESGIGLIDTAFWSIKGVAALDPILQKSGEFGVRWGFVDRKEYIPELRKNGWVFIKELKNGVQLWENPLAVLPKPIQPPQENPLASFSWGVFPMLSFITMITLGALSVWPRSASKFFQGAHAFFVGLIPLSCGFWYYKLAGNFEHSRVYFTYDHALFFLSDGLAVISVILWLAVQVREAGFSITKFSRTIYALFLLCCLITLSIFWSTDWQTSLYISLHFWLVFGLVLSMRDWPESWNTVMLGLCALLGIEAVAGVVGFVVRSTTFLDPLHIEWPGNLESFTSGASKIRFSDGEAFLRAYGTLPHPNILGGFLLISFIGAIALFLRKEQPNQLANLLLAVGSSLLTLTFSRSAWIGAVIFFSLLCYKSKFLDRKKVVTVALVAGIAFCLTLLPLRDLFISRTTGLNSTTEEFSITARLWLTKQSFALIKEHPVLGGGAGSFVIQLAQRAGEFYLVEPVHNIPLLVMSELGIFGLILLIAIVIMIGKTFLQSNNPNVILVGALLGGLGVIGMLDHYFWTLAPGRLMLGLVLGLWEGQVARDGT